LPYTVNDFVLTLGLPGCLLNLALSYLLTCFYPSLSLMAHFRWGIGP